jgi:hypothetical protein
MTITFLLGTVKPNAGNIVELKIPAPAAVNKWRRLNMNWLGFCMADPYFCLEK